MMRGVTGVRKSIHQDHRVSIETISGQFDVSVATVHTIIREELKMGRFA